MVRLAGFQAINQSADQIAEQEAQQTIEAQEFRVIELYEAALRAARCQDVTGAESYFRQVLQDPLVRKGATEQALRLRFLSLKNLAAVVANCEGRIQDALEAYRLASEENSNDVALWDRFGSLGAKAGEWAIARAAFQHVLQLDPTHPTAATKLLRVLLHTGDSAAAKAFATTCHSQGMTNPLFRETAQVGIAVGNIPVASASPLPCLPEVEGNIQSLEELFDNSAPTTVLQLRSLTWAELLGRLVSLVSDPGTASGKVRFRAPPKAVEASQSAISCATTMANAVEVSNAGERPGVVADARIQSLLQQPSATREDSSADADHGAANVIMTSLETEHPMGQQLEEVPSLHTGNQSFGSPVEALKPSETAQQTPNTNVRPGPSSDFQPHTVPTTTTPQGQPGSEDTPQARRSSRTTKGLHSKRHLQRAQVSTSAARCPTPINDDDTKDTFDVIRVLAPLVGRPEAEPSLRPNDPSRGAVALDAVSPPAVSTALQAGDDEEEKTKEEEEKRKEIEAMEQAISKAVLNRPSGMAVLHLAINLVQKWTRHRDAAAELRGQGGVEGLLQLVFALQQHLHWNGNDVSADACLVLGELYVDAAAYRARAESSLNGMASAADINHVPSTPSRSKTSPHHRQSPLSLKQLRQSAVLWLSKYCAMAQDPPLRPLTEVNRILTSQEKVELARNCGDLPLQRVGHRLLNIIHSEQNTASDHSCGGDTQADGTEELMLRDLKHFVDSEIESLRSARYWWARGRLHESFGQPAQAATCYRHCSTELSRKGWSVVLPHCREDAVVTPTTLSNKREVLRLHAKIRLGQDLASKDEYDASVAILSPALLSCCSRETHLASIDIRGWFQALKVLMRTADKTGNIRLGLRCQLRALHASLPLVPTTLQKWMDEGCEGDPRSIKDVCIQLGSIEKLSSALASAAAYFATNEEMVQRCGELSLHPYEIQMIQSALRQLLYVMNSCDTQLKLYPDPTSALGAGMHTLKLAMCDAAICALQLWPLDPNAYASVEGLLDWTFGLTEALGDAQALFQRDAAFPACLMHHILSGIRRGEAAVQESITSPDSVKEIQESMTTLRYGLQHCLHWMYGLPLQRMNAEQWGGEASAAEVPPMGLRPLTSRSQALKLWPLVADNLQGHRARSHHLFLETMGSLFPSPPPVLAEACGAIWNEVENRKHPASTQDTQDVWRQFDRLLQKVLVSNPEQRSDIEEHLPVFSSMFYLRGSTFAAGNVASALDKVLEERNLFDGNALCRESIDAIRSWLAPWRWDLIFNPRRVDSWEYLARAHHEVADRIELYGAKFVLAREWRHRLDIVSQVNRHRHLAVWCTSICESLLEDDDELVPMLLELTATKQYARLRNAPPRFDQLELVPQRSDAQMQEEASVALTAFMRCAELLPGEYYYPMYIGKLMRKLGKPAAEYLPELALSCALATRYHNGLLEPVYALHSARLRVLDSCCIDQEPETLRLLGTYCFKQEHQQLLERLLPPSTESCILTPPFAREVAEIIRADGITAMNWCIESNFYPASLRMAKMASRPHEALTYLSPLFTRPKSAASFAFNMHALVERASTGSGQRSRQYRRSKSRKAPATSGMTSPLHVEAGAIDDEEEDTDLGPPSNYGLCPSARVVGVGESETERTYIGRLRKALRMYIELLSRRRSWELLSSVAIYLETAKDRSGAGFDDMRALARGHYLISLLQSSTQLCPIDHLIAGVPEAGHAGSEDAYHLQTLERVATQLDYKVAHPLLKRMYDTWVDHGLQPLGNAMPGRSMDWLSGVAAPMRFALPYFHWDDSANIDQLRQLICNAQFTMAVWQVYAWLYVLLLQHGELAAEGIEALIARLKRRFKTLPKRNESVHSLFALLYSRGLKALQKATDPLLAAAKLLAPVTVEEEGNVAYVAAAASSEPGPSSQAIENHFTRTQGVVRADVEMFVAGDDVDQEQHLHLAMEPRNNPLSYGPTADPILHDTSMHQFMPLQAEQGSNRMPSPPWMVPQMPTVLSLPEPVSERAFLLEQLVRALTSARSFIKSIPKSQIPHGAGSTELKRISVAAEALLLAVYASCSTLSGSRLEPTASSAQLMKACDAFLKAQRRVSKARDDQQAKAAGATGKAQSVTQSVKS